MFTSRLLPPAARLLCGESRQSGGNWGRDGGAEAAVSVLDAPGSSRLVLPQTCLKSVLGTVYLLQGCTNCDILSSVFFFGGGGVILPFVTEKQINFQYKEYQNLNHQPLIPL